MDLYGFTSGLLTGVREGVEAALIVSIVLAYLAKTGNRRHFGKIWIGAGAAVGLSALAGVAIFLTAGKLEEPYEQIFEGAAMLVAAAVVTWMLFWMRRQARGVKGDLQSAVDRALTSSGSMWALGILAFSAVIREGLETSIFLVAQVAAADQGSATGGTSVVVGALAGLVLAVVFGFVLYQGSRRINLGRFFRWTGVALVFIAAGLLSHAVHEFIEIGAINVGRQTAFDISAVLPHETGIGEFLNALFGYTSTPEVATLVTYLVYLVVVLALYLRPLRSTPPSVRRGPAEAASS